MKQQYLILQNSKLELVQMIESCTFVGSTVLLILIDNKKKEAFQAARLDLEKNHQQYVDSDQLKNKGLLSLLFTCRLTAQNKN